MTSSIDIELENSNADYKKLAKIASGMRDDVHNLDLTLDEHIKIYNKYKLQYIALFEDVRLKAYDDGVSDKSKYKYMDAIRAAGRKPVGKVTVGVGFNMDAPGARKEWQKVFGNKVSFDDVYNCRIEITEDQSLALFNSSVQIREKLLEDAYGPVWLPLRVNEKIVILSACYNGYSLVSPNTNFFHNIKNYVETSDEKYLLAATQELGLRSRKNPQLIGRRLVDAIMLDSTRCPFYSRPNQNV
jgi:hypothetical protein